jgi:hypothetical protein
VAEGDETAAPAKASAKEEPAAIPVERLIEEADAFLGVSSAVAAGALSTEKKKALTVDDAKEAVDTWLKADVKVDEEDRT